MIKNLISIYCTFCLLFTFDIFSLFNYQFNYIHDLYGLRHVAFGYEEKKRIFAS